MIFKVFKQHKLVRDKIVELMENQGSKLYWLQLSDQDFIKQLKIKLLEEVHELITSTSQQNFIEEMADVQEVLDALLSTQKISKEEIIQAQTNKREMYGGYHKKIFLTLAEHPKDSKQELYCLTNPEKYPEVKL